MKNLIIAFVLLISFTAFSKSFTIDNKTLNDKNIDIVQTIYADFAKGDVPAVLQKFDPKIEWREAENFPYTDGDPFIGPQAVLEGVFARLGAEWEYWNLTEQKYYEAKSGEIIVTGRYKAKNKTTGKIINTQFVHMWSLEDGLVTKFQQFADTYQTVEEMK